MFKERIGFFIGNFDPIHIGHLSVITECLNNNLVDSIVIVPLVSEDEEHFAHKCNMIRVATKYLKNVSMSSIDKVIIDHSTEAILNVLYELYNLDHLAIITCEDINIPFVQENFDIIEVLEKKINISSEEVRELVKSGKEVLPYVLKDVKDYILYYKLYI